MNLLRFLPGDAIPGFDSDRLVTQHADEHIRTTDGEAHCSLWWSTVPPMENEKPGLIGHFHTSNAEAGKFLLEQALQILQREGCTIAVGPMDGNTWRRYRLLSERGSEPAFFMEPDNPDFWPGVFQAAEFAPLATYSSLLVTDLEKRDPRADRTLERLKKDGVAIRPLDPDRFEDDLRHIFKVSVVSFTGNYLYTELPEDAFLAQYLPYKDKIQPDLVLLAEQAGATVGYLFAIPDYTEAQRGEPIRTVIGKTLAVMPGRRYGGLGVVLADLLHERARAAGYSRVIHALQHESNKVQNMSTFFGEKMRRYTLYARRLK